MLEKSCKKRLTDFQPWERIVDDADQHASGFHVVGRSIKEEAPLSLPGWFDQNVTPVEVPEANVSWELTQTTLTALRSGC